MYDNVLAEKIAQRYKEKPFTDFASIDQETKLEGLNLNWRERDLPEMLRTKHVHRLHPYMGKFIPQLVEIFLRKYSPTLVYDPFCGSGTTLVEANALGVDAIGTDISIFNVMLSNVKTTKYDISILEKESHDVLDKIHLQKNGLFFDNKPKKFKQEENEYLKTWFSPRALKELSYYHSLINNYTYKDFFKIILSRAARSARLVTHYDLDFPKKPQTTEYYCYKHDRICKPVDEANKFLIRYTLDALARVKEFDKIRTSAKVAINHADSREVKLPKGIDMIFTSPPYVGLIDYHEQHRYAYEFLSLANNEQREIGAAKNGQSEQARQEYIKGVNEVLIHTRDFMSKKALALIVVNDKNRLYEAESVGFKAIGKIDRHVNRRTGRRDSAFYESVLIWEKD